MISFNAVDSISTLHNTTTGENSNYLSWSINNVYNAIEIKNITVNIELTLPKIISEEKFVISPTQSKFFAIPDKQSTSKVAEQYTTYKTIWHKQDIKSSETITFMISFPIIFARCNYVKQGSLYLKKTLKFQILFWSCVAIWFGVFGYKYFKKMYEKIKLANSYDKYNNEDENIINKDS